MGNVLIIILGIILGLVALVSLATAIGIESLRRMVYQEVSAMLPPALKEKQVITEADLVGLPEPVQRYLRYAGVIGKKPVQTVRMIQQGDFRTGLTHPFMPITAWQHTVIDEPVRIWRARMDAPLSLPIVGRDKYAGGRGYILIKILGLIPVVNASGPDIDQGVRLVFLNDMVMIPTAFLSDLVQWEAIDDHSARLSMTYGGQTVTAVLTFNETGEITNFVARRQGNFGLQEWSTPLRNYQERGGFRIPTEADVIWHLDSGDFVYYKVTIVEIEYDTLAIYR